MLLLCMWVNRNIRNKEWYGRRPVIIYRAPFCNWGRWSVVRDLTEVGRTRPERTMSGVVRRAVWVFRPRLEVVVRGNPAGMNSYGDRLHFEAHSRAKFEKTSLSTDGLPCPLQNWFRLLPRGRFSPGTEDSGGGFRTPDGAIPPAESFVLAKTWP